MAGRSGGFDRVIRPFFSVLVGDNFEFARLIDDVGLDSVAFAVGMVAIEERLGVALSEEELLTCDTVGDLDAAIAAKSGK